MKSPFVVKVMLFDGSVYTVNLGSVSLKDDKKYYLTSSLEEAKGSSSQVKKSKLLDSMMKSSRFEISKFTYESLRKTKKDFMKSKKAS